MTAPALLRQLAQPALDAYQNTVTVTVPTRLLTALADLDEAARAYRTFQSLKNSDRLRAAFMAVDRAAELAEVERAAKEHTSQ